VIFNGKIIILNINT